MFHFSTLLVQAAGGIVQEFSGPGASCVLSRNCLDREPLCRVVCMCVCTYVSIPVCMCTCVCPRLVLVCLLARDLLLALAVSSPAWPQPLARAWSDFGQSPGSRVFKLEGTWIPPGALSSEAQRG